MANEVRYTKENGVAVVVIDHPPLNVLTRDIFLQLDETFQVLDNDDDVVVVILTTAGNRAFIAGVDVKAFPRLMEQSNLRAEVMQIHRVMMHIEDFSKPTIVVLDGATLGGGLELALAFDIRIAEEHAQIGLPEVKLGLFPGGGGTQRLSRLVGEAKAKEMMFTGEPVAAAVAERIGLVNQVVATGAGLMAAREMAANIARHSRQSLTRIKRAVDQGMEMPLERAIEHEADLFVEVFHTEDVREGVNAFLQHRKPVFQHR
ncbi:enoyl-CoA hydratase [Alicyclobacillus acidoterrestris]|nr:enoyl-CoA hydratase [Alicyclobacillus acidoterrestris]